MKVISDHKNKATIAIGYHNGVEVKSVCVCKEDDIFDEKFGRKLAVKRFDQKKTKIRIKKLNSDIQTLEKMISNAKKEKEILEKKYDRQESVINEFVFERYASQKLKNAEEYAARPDAVRHDFEEVRNEMRNKLIGMQ